MSKERDDRSGRYVQKATLDDVLAVFDAVDGPPVVTSADVADATGLSRDSARRKLETLRDRGKVAKRKTAGRVLYWPTDATETRERHESAVQNDAVDTTTKTDDATPAGDTRGDAGSAREGGRASERAIDAVDTDELPATVDREDAAAAIAAARDYIRDEDGAKKAEIVTEIMPDYPLGYDADAALEKIDAGDRYRGSWWRKVVTPALETLDDVEKPPVGGSKWTYSGDT